jgi:hypothetical protein
MRTPEQVKWDFVQQWLDKAHKDLAAAEVLLKEGCGEYLGFFRLACGLPGTVT